MLIPSLVPYYMKHMRDTKNSVHFFVESTILSVRVTYCTMNLALASYSSAIAVSMCYIAVEDRSVFGSLSSHNMYKRAFIMIAVHVELASYSCCIEWAVAVAIYYAILVFS